MRTAIVTGPWQLRHNEPSNAPASLHAAEIAGAPSGSSFIVDMRQYGLANIDPDYSPLALVCIDGKTINFEALVLRQDEHQVHFIRPGALGDCPADALDHGLRTLFERWHLRLNNFECCIFPADELSAAVHAELEAAHISPVVDETLDSLSTGAWPGFHLQSGSEVQHLRGLVTILASVDGKTIVGVKLGARRKKDGPDQPAWHIEQFKQDAEGWFRRKIAEPKSVDLRLFDQSPTNVGSLQWPQEGPFRRLCSIRENLIRIGVESATRPALIEIDIAHRICLDASILENTAFRLLQRSITVRPVAGRAPLSPEAAANASAKVLDCIRGLQSARSLGARKSDMPGGLSPANSATLKGAASRQ